MNYAIVFRLLGYILMIEGTLLLLPAVTSLIYAEWAVMGVFLLTAAISAALGFALRTIKPRSKVFYMREGFAATALSWITISIMGAVPFVLTGCIPNPVDAMFETVSGFTTTGASILPGVEGLPNGILFWRSFTHWIGGMGVLVFLLSLLPLTGGSHVNLMKAESPGPQVDKLVPKVQSTAKILYGIYLVSTLLELVFLLTGHMDYTVPLGNLLGGVAAILNFFLMGWTIQRAVGLDEKAAAAKLKLSQLLRMLMLIVICCVGIALNCFQTVAVIVPLFFPRIGVAFRPLFDKKNGQATSGGKDDVKID